jgi:hypothetical protein
MKRTIMVMVLVTIFMSLSGCFFVERDDEGGWHRRHGGHEGHHEERR